jgi:hypothetical protein
MIYPSMKQCLLAGCDLQQEEGMKLVKLPLKAKPAARDTQDSGAVAIGAMTPSFPPVKATPSESKDSNQVRLGAMSPAFPG